MTSEETRIDPFGGGLRLLHYTLIVLVLCLALTGFAIYLREPLGIAQFKIPLVYLHAFVAYGLLAWIGLRLAGSWLGKKRMPLARALPRSADLGRALQDIRTGKPRFAGRSGLSRVLTGSLYASFLIMALTGLVRTGTDLYHLPLGPLVQSYVAQEGVNPQTIAPFDRTGTDEGRYNRVMGAKVKITKVHIYVAFFIVFVALVHMSGVLIREWSLPNSRRRGSARVMLFGPDKSGSQ